MTRLRIACLLLPTLVALSGVAACQRQPDPAPATQTAPVAIVPAPLADPAPPLAETARIDTIAEVDHGAGPVDVDVKALAGVFSGTLPCADCPGIKTTLRLKADGSYILHELYVDRDDQDGGSEGAWTADQKDRRIRLDPDSKDADGRLFRIVSNDELEMLDSDGNPPDSDLDYSLKRSGVVAP